MKLQTKLFLIVSACSIASSVPVLSCSSSSTNDGSGGQSSGGGAAGANMASGGKGGSGSGGSDQSAGGGSSASGGAGGKGGANVQSGGFSGNVGAGGSGLPTTNTATCVPPKLKFVSVAKAADSPMAVAQVAGDARLFVAERAGIIRIFRNGALEPMPFADFRANVMVPGNDNTTERGLLNLVLHPNFTANGRFYVYYTRKTNDPLSQGGLGDIVIAEGRRVGTTDKAETTLKVLTTVSHYEDNHIGGMLAFGPDGMLYAGVGDGGGSGGFDPFHAGQDKKQKLSKILRIDVEKPTEKPAGNIDAEGADIHAWAYGVRNPFRGSFDRATGDLYFGDVGESSYEEIDFAPPGQTGLNFGWGYDATQKVGADQKQSGMEGLHPMPYFTAVEWAPRDYLPIFEYPHDGAGWSAAGASYMKMGYACNGMACSAAVIGGFVYRGKKIPGIYGRYFFGDNPRNKINSFIVADKKATCQVDLTADLVTGNTLLQGLSGFGEDAEGELYVLDLMGNIYRIEAE